MVSLLYSEVNLLGLVVLVLVLFRWRSSLT